MSVTEALRADSRGPRHLGFIFGEVYHTPLPSFFSTRSCTEKETRIKDQSTVLAVILQLSQTAERETWTSGDDDIKETQSVPCLKTAAAVAAERLRRNDCLLFPLVHRTVRSCDALQLQLLGALGDQPNGLDRKRLGSDTTQRRNRSSYVQLLLPTFGAADGPASRTLPAAELRSVLATSASGRRLLVSVETTETRRRTEWFKVRRLGEEWATI